MNLNLETFIRDAKAIAELRGISWDVQLGPDGVALKGMGWNLTQMVKAAPPPTDWLNDFGTDQKTVEVLNAAPPSGPARTYSKKQLSRGWRDLIKAVAIDQLFVRKNTCSHVVGNVVRPLRVLATCAASTDPSVLTVDDVAFSIDTARKVQASGKLADLIYGVVRSILDPNHLLDNGPLSPLLERDKKIHIRTSKFVKAVNDLRSDLEERKHAEKLPERKAFWELVRIVFTETPRSFLDLLRFAQAKTLILTGLRDGECAVLPADWKRVREYFEVHDQPAGLSGGVSRSLMLRHFAEKQRVRGKDGIALFETMQHVPAVFETVLESTLNQVVAATEPLRNTLRRQLETGRILPQFERGDLVRTAELYTYLTGNPFVVKLPEEYRRKYVEAYQREFNPAIFDDLRAEQMKAIRDGQELEKATYNYLRRLKGIPLRKANGTSWDGDLEGKKTWSEIYFRVEEIETYLKNGLATKQSDCASIRLSDGELSAWELLFLMPKRALSDGRNEGLCDITRHYAIGRIDRQMTTYFLSTGKEQTIFSVYGQTDEDRQMTLRPHSLRHLQNTELFRLGIADTIITKRFNRRSVTQSYEYDHRSLAEELEQIELKPEVEARLGEKSATIARLIKSGKARGPIVDAFKRIQLTDGEDAAFEYLGTEADGFHSTPYGHCINSFMVDPCPKHLECFNGCKHLSATDLSQNRHNLVQLEGRFSTAVKILEERKARMIESGQKQLESGEGGKGSYELDSAKRALQGRIATSIGLDNQLAHAQERLAGVRRLLETPAGTLVFPDGKDLSINQVEQKRTVLDD
ncbi:MAG: hypothetical protein P4K83_05080 [Terracidiphilus sp.]|nr:hypothetical protein [Terracidiphilus sp.]